MSEAVWALLALAIFIHVGLAIAYHRMRLRLIVATRLFRETAAEMLVDLKTQSEGRFRAECKLAAALHVLKRAGIEGEFRELASDNGITLEGTFISGGEKPLKKEVMH